MQVIEKYAPKVSQIAKELAVPVGEVLRLIDVRITEKKPGEVCLLHSGAKLTVVNDKGTWKVAVYSYAQGRTDVPQAWSGKVS